MKTFLLPIVASVLLGAAACSVPDLNVSEGLQQDATVMPVVGRSAFRLSVGKEKGFGFGPFQLQDIQRGWTRRTGTGERSPLQVAEAYQKYSFSLVDTVQHQKVPVQAAALLNATSLQAGGVSVALDKQREFLHVAFPSPEGGEWRLSLADPGNFMERKNFLGKLSNGTLEIEVYPLYRWQGKTIPSGTALGYEFSREGHVLATVQTMNNGKVWLKNSLSPDLRLALAGACGALLLYNQLDQDNP
ncbi:hypothetical protein ACD591_13810 [Rufibacter glacialis]|uniref:Lipoprotein n=1 Tax=Rufibacter glacialis TaxID=1259555 RepID=A0A5M8Q753_9BACT|nr:hypothetical protein [Rufibacter glacialis]KAA6431073.1 hypothetical protein FOE74_18415 [Rufibacter glacialis]GGK83774.1 hypothetical protein GCM10011405_34620 [Rufibacter glacialis]